MKKRILSLLTTLVMVVGLVGVVPTVNSKAESITTVERPVLSEDSAAVFLCFLKNKGSMTEEEVKSNPMYQIMTNTYTGDDEYNQMVATTYFIRSATQEMATQAADNKSYLIDQIVKYLENRVGSIDNLDQEIVNEYYNNALNELTNAIKGTVDNVFQQPCDSYFNVSDIFSSYSSLTGTTAKATKMVDDTITAMKGFLTVMQCELSGRYSYFSCYLSNRPNYSSPDDVAFETIMEYNRLAATDNNWLANMLDTVTWITGKDSFTNHFDTMDAWAEFSYQLELYQKSLNSSSLGGTTESSQPNIGDTFKIDNLTYKIISDSEVEVFKCDTSAITVDVPEFVSYNKNGFLVTSIGDCAFAYCSNLVSISLPDSVTIIGVCAFKCCDKLTSITIPNSVTIIKSGTFCYCSNLISITIPNSVTIIAESAFYDCSNLTSIIIPDGVTSIMNHTFEGCNKLTSIKIPNSVTAIGIGAFQYCNSLTNVTMSNSITGIGLFAFNGCLSLIITCYRDSYVEKYAIDNKIKYELICEHNYESEITTPATCTSGGVITYTCSTCGDTYSETIPATGHKSVTDKAQSATCTGDGKTEGSHCSVCGEIIKEQEIIPKLGHDYNVSSTTPATCTSDGIITYTCSTCGDTYTEAISAIGHKYEDIVHNATCTEQGYTEHKCSVCGDIYIDSFTESIGHDYVEKIIQPTETEQGYTLHTCTICGDSYKDNYTDYKPIIDVIIDKIDINADGNISTADVGLINAHAKGTRLLSGEALEKADINKDGKVSTADVGLINAYAKGTKKYA